VTRGGRARPRAATAETARGAAQSRPHSYHAIWNVVRRIPREREGVEFDQRGRVRLERHAWRGAAARARAARRGSARRAAPR